MADQTLYEIIQQQKHLKETEAKLVGLLEKIQSSINHLTVSILVPWTFNIEVSIGRSLIKIPLILIH